jgi:hypothetical protein
MTWFLRLLLVISTVAWSSSSAFAFRSAAFDSGLSARHRHHRVTASFSSSSSIALGQSRYSDDDDSTKTPFIGVPSVDQQQPQYSTLRDSNAFDAGTTVPRINTSGDGAGAFLFDRSALTNRFLAWADSVQQSLDEVSNGWALTYADLSPDSPQTLPGATFLATNAAYFLVGLYLFANGDVWFGFWTDACAICSFNYHYNQLMATGTTQAASVRLALFLDYIAAAISMSTATLYILHSDVVPFEALAVSGVGLIFLAMSWVYEYGRPYMIWHSLWHLSSAYSGYLIGSLHAAGAVAATAASVAATTSTGSL